MTHPILSNHFALHSIITFYHYMEIHLIILEELAKMANAEFNITLGFGLNSSFERINKILFIM